MLLIVWCAVTAASALQSTFPAFDWLWLQFCWNTFGCQKEKKKYWKTSFFTHHSSLAEAHRCKLSRLELFHVERLGHLNFWHRSHRCKAFTRTRTRYFAPPLLPLLPLRGANPNPHRALIVQLPCRCVHVRGCAHVRACVSVRVCVYMHAREGSWGDSILLGKPLACNLPRTRLYTHSGSTVTWDPCNFHTQWEVNFKATLLELLGLILKRVWNVKRKKVQWKVTFVFFNCSLWPCWAHI